MSVFWLQPQAWWALAALAVPVLIHLLARHNSRRLPFPSLRFLRTTRLAALRRRAIADWPLLIVRMLLLTVVVAALAAPVLVSEGRRAEWNQRVARAIVVTGGNSAAELVADEQRGSFASAVFTPPTVADGLRTAAIWLARQAPAAREVVIAGDLREGAVHQGDFAALDPEVGIRFLPLPAADKNATTTARVVTDAGDATASTFDVLVTANDRSTTARYARAAQESSPAMAVRASAAEQPHADAVLRAVLREGVRFGRDIDRAVTIVFTGVPDVGRLAVPSMPWGREALERLPAAGGDLQGRLVIVAPMRATDQSAAAFVARVAHVVFADPFDAIEPRSIGPSTLAAWSRGPGPSPHTALPADEGDRRVLWSVALILLGVEQLLRRSRRAADTPIADESQEPRVA